MTLSVNDWKFKVIKDTEKQNNTNNWELTTLLPQWRIKVDYSIKYKAIELLEFS
jgi:hypothetical protein